MIAEEIDDKLDEYIESWFDNDNKHSAIVG